MDLEVIYRVPAHDLRRLSSGDYPAVGTAVANFSANLTYKRLYVALRLAFGANVRISLGPPEFADEFWSSCPATDL